MSKSRGRFDVTGLSDAVTSLETLGTAADAAVVTDAPGSISGKLRGVVALIVSLLSRLPAALGAGGGLPVEGIAGGTEMPVRGIVEFTADARVGKLTHAEVTCTLADTDYTQAIPDTAIGIKMRSVTTGAIFAIDEETSATVGGRLFPDETEVRLLEEGESRVLHLQSPVAATVVAVEFF